MNLQWVVDANLACVVFAACLTWALLLSQLHSSTFLSRVHEKHLAILKAVRISAYGILAAGESAIIIVRAVRHAPHWQSAFRIEDLLTLTTWLFITVSLWAVWKRQGALRALPLALASLLLGTAALASNTVLPPDTSDYDSDAVMGLVIHSLEIVLLVMVCIMELVLLQHINSLLSGEGQPLLEEDEAEKEKEERKAKKAREAGREITRVTMTMRAFRYVWPEEAPLRMRLFACFVLVMTERCVNLALPVLYKHMVETLSQASAMQHAAAMLMGRSEPVMQLVVRTLQDANQHISWWSLFHPWVLSYLGLYFLRGGSGLEGLLANIRDILWIPITQAAFRRVSLDVFAHLLELDHTFHMKRKTGMIMRILDRGTSSIQDTVSIVLFNVVPQLLDIVVACGYLALYMQPWAALIVFVTVASYVPLTIIITERRGAIRKRMNALDNAREGRATDMLLNYETVKFFSNEQFELNEYDTATRQFQAAEYWQMAFLSLLSMVQGLVVWAGLASGMVVCVRGVAAGTLTVGDAVLFITMMNQLYVPLTFFGSYYRQVQKALIDMENMLQLLLTEPRVREPPGARPLRVTNGEVTFDNVHFAYKPDAPPVLKGVSFRVPGGKTLAVVGATGSGKSTILRLLLRFYDPTSGRVLIDGQDIARVTTSSVRRAIAVVPQDTVLFNNTVMYNIRYGRTSASDFEVLDAAQAAHIHDAIMTRFKKGYDTRVGERGLRLSGGEKQRVAFARAVLKRPSILVLDEATSALDSLTEHQIQSSLAELRQGLQCTNIIVAHRLSTIMDADCILVLDRGQVAQLGTHAELIEQPGLYAAMWAHQKDTASSHADLEQLLNRASASTGAATSATTRSHLTLPIINSPGGGSVAGDDGSGSGNGNGSRFEVEEVDQQWDGEERRAGEAGGTAQRGHLISGGLAGLHGSNVPSRFRRELSSSGLPPLAHPHAAAPASSGAAAAAAAAHHLHGAPPHVHRSSDVPHLALDIHPVGAAMLESAPSATPADDDADSAVPHHLTSRHPTPARGRLDRRADAAADPDDRADLMGDGEDNGEDGGQT